MGGGGAGVQWPCDRLAGTDQASAGGERSVWGFSGGDVFVAEFARIREAANAGRNSCEFRYDARRSREQPCRSRIRKNSGGQQCRREFLRIPLRRRGSAVNPKE